jgi:type I restriction enzyme S subunit
VIPQDYILKTNDIIVTMTDLSKQADTLGFSAKVPKSNKNTFLHNQRIGLVKLTDNEYCKDFIYWLMRTNEYQSFIAGSATGATVKHTSPSKIYAYKFSAPENLITQQRIASILSTYDDMIENNLKRIMLLEEIAQRTYEEWFVKFRIKGVQLEVGENGLPVGWKYGTLNDIISFQNGFAFKSNKFVDIGQPVIKIKNIGNNTVDVINTDCVEEEYANTATKFKLSVGDLVIAMTGATVGKVGYVPYSKKECYLNQRVGRFVELNGMNNLHFVFSVMTQGDGLLQVLNLAGGAAQPNISGNQILSIKTVIATKEILNSFHLIANENINQILNLQNQNLLLKESRDILLPRLMSGKVGV